MTLRKYLRRRAFEFGAELASREGRNPLELAQTATRAECGFPPFEGENIIDYLARAAGVPRNVVARYRERQGRGVRPLPEMEKIHAFMEAVGRRVVGRK